LRLAVAILLGAFLAFVLIGAIGEGLPLAAIVCALGLAVLVKPVGGRLLEPRGISGWGRIGISGGLLFAGLLIIGATVAARPEQVAARQKRAAERAAAEKAETQAGAKSAAAEARTAKAARQEEAARTKATTEAAVVSGFREMLAAAEPCDAAFKRMGSIDARDGALWAYTQARDGQATCEAAWLTISRMKPGEALEGEIETAVEGAIDRCGTAYFLRKRALEKMMAVLDGEGRPSAMLALQDDAKAGQEGVLVCVASWYDAAGKAGVKPDALR
jgi:hypothetical protein